MGYISCSYFDGMLLKTVNELTYENDVLDVPYPPDVGDYLQVKVCSCYLYVVWFVINVHNFISLYFQ